MPNFGFDINNIPQPILIIGILVVIYLVVFKKKKK